MYNSKINSLIYHILLFTFVLIKSGQCKTTTLCKTLSVRGKTQLICQAICDENCVNGVCDYLPKRCICNKGYHPEKSKCQPDCAAGCPPNSNCVVGSNDCRCNDGYEKDAVGQCAPTCSAGCGEGGYCTAPNTCTCKMGYIQSGNGCQPLCTKICGINAHCAQPEVCECLAGFENKTAVGLEQSCEPICTAPCPRHAYCAAPNQCRCVTGYSLIGDECVPRCKDACGHHSSCIAPDTCRCDIGYLEQDGGCVQKCMKEIRVLYISMVVPCEEKTFVVYLACGALGALLLVCTLIICKFWKSLRHKSPYRDRNHIEMSKI